MQSCLNKITVAVSLGCAVIRKLKFLDDEMQHTDKKKQRKMISQDDITATIHELSRSNLFLKPSTSFLVKIIRAFDIALCGHDSSSTELLTLLKVIESSSSIQDDCNALFHHLLRRMTQYITNLNCISGAENILMVLSGIIFADNSSITIQKQKQITKTIIAAIHKSVIGECCNNHVIKIDITNKYLIYERLGSVMALLRAAIRKILSFNSETTYRAEIIVLVGNINTT